MNFYWTGNTCYSHCPRCGGAAYTGDFSHAAGCTWPTPQPQYITGVIPAAGDYSDIAEKLDIIIGLLREILSGGTGRKG